MPLWRIDQLKEQLTRISAGALFAFPMISLMVDVLQQIYSSIAKMVLKTTYMAYLLQL
jgi:hypothetical protein